MSYLLDTDICSAYLKDDRRVATKVMMHYGGLHLSVTTVGELLTWARRAAAPARRLSGVLDLIRVSNIQSVDLVVAETFGTLRAELFDRGRVIASQDLWNASIAIVQNLTVVTHNTQDYQGIPGLRVEDWLSP